MHCKKQSYIPTSELLIKKIIVYEHLYAPRIYISVNWNNLIVMSKILTGKLQNKNTQEISYMNNYIVYSSALPLAQLLFHQATKSVSVYLHKCPSPSRTVKYNEKRPHCLIIYWHNVQLKCFICWKQTSQTDWIISVKLAPSVFFFHKRSLCA